MENRFTIIKFTPQEWIDLYAKDAHTICFNGEAFPEGEEFDFALLCVDEKQKKPAGYMTCKETKDGVYLKHGGGFPSVTKSILSFHTYIKLMEHISSLYDNIETKVYNTNIPYLKMAMAIGLLPTGVEVYNGKYLLKLSRRKDGGHYAV